MLKIYKNVFDNLNDNNIYYAVYKGLDHLAEDLNGARGDIDILVNKEDLDIFTKVLTKHGFKKIIKDDLPFYYFAMDKQEYKFIMLDVDCKVRLGDKPYKPYYYEFDLKKLKRKMENGVWVVDMQDYLPLLFLQKATSSNAKSEDLTILKTELKNNYDIKSAYVGRELAKLVGISWELIEKDIINATDWMAIHQKYKQKIIENVSKQKILEVKQKFKVLRYVKDKIDRKIFKKPPYNLRKKGFLVAFIGVDGAGKSSSVDYLLGLDYFKHTGIKRIYFGNNEYWVPGLLWGLKNIKNRFILRILGLIGYYDKVLRSVIAFYYIKRGNIVIADRFYYDDIIGLKLANDRGTISSKYQKLYYKIFPPKVWIKPQKTIFLDVSPEVAYKRKQDFSYEIMLEVNKAYKEYMPTVDDVVVINADQDQKIIFDEVVKNILELDQS